MPRLLFIIGCVFIALALVWQYAPWMINWIGKLPGDINIKNENTRVFIPITSMILISIILSLIMNFLRH